MDNQRIAEAFEELADLLEFKGENPFRIRAYRSGARAIRDLGESVSEILQDPSRDLAAIPGIGKTLVDKSRTLVETGELPQLIELRKDVPASVLQMVNIPGLGPKKAAALFRELGIETLDALREACESGQVAKLKGFGGKTQQAILDGLEIAVAANERMRWADADAWVQRLRTHLTQCDAIQRIEFAGSYRRGRETVGDLDILCIAADRNAAMDHFESFPERTETIARGDEKKTKISIRIANAFQVDLRLVEPGQFGAALQYFTGSQAHNVHLRSMARRRGLKINEYGVFRDDETVSITGDDEADVYAALQLPYVPPELREDRNEFAWAASEQGLPELLTIEQIRGDLHMHTTATDGECSIREMADAAIERGLTYIAITDHSRRVTMANGLDASRLRAQWDEIDRIREQYAGRLTILKGIECDILENGEMDLPNDCLAEADWVLASIHYGQRQPREQITQRLLGAIQHPSVSCIAHPTGRLINKRPAYEVDMDAVFEAAARYGKMLELNANPARLDLHDIHCVAAKNQNIPIVINTDAHSIHGLDVMRFGILQARRAGLTAKDVANTASWEELKSRVGREL